MIGSTNITKPSPQGRATSSSLRPSDFQTLRPSDLQTFRLSDQKPAFTLLELIIALLLLAIIMGLVFSTARSSLLLGTNVVKTQNEASLHQAFFNLLENRLSSLPGNTRMELTVTDSASHYLSDLTLQNVPLSLTWGNQERTAKTVQLSTVLRRSGLLDIVLRYYENEILDPLDVDRTSSSYRKNSDEPFAEIILLSNVYMFEWRVLDANNLEEYEYEWDQAGRLPLQLELTCSFNANGPKIRHVFWIPPRQNPEFVIRQLQNNRGNPQPPTDPSNPANPPGVEITPPGTGTTPPGTGTTPPGIELPNQ